MSDSYSAEWNNINRIAKGVQSARAEIESVQAQAQEIQSQISRLPVETDENGNDINEGLRNLLYDELSSLNARMSSAQNEIRSLRGSADSLARGYSTQAQSFTNSAVKTGGVKRDFDILSNRRFGGRTAAAAAATTGQREKHYSDRAAALNALADAARAAGDGISSSGGGTTISERGTFGLPDVKAGSKGGGYTGGTRGTSAAGSAGFSGAAGGSWSGVPGESVKTTTSNNANAVMGAAGLTGIAHKGGAPDYSPVSHAAVSLPTQTAPGNQIAMADAAFARQMGMSGADAAAYREENGLAWAIGSDGKANLVPASVCQAYGGRCTGAGNRPVTPLDALSAYMNAHNYGKQDAGTYMKDPEWQRLHSAAFPDYTPDFTEMVRDGVVSGKFQDLLEYKDFKEKPSLVDRKTFDREVKESGMICFRTFSDDTTNHVSAGTYKNRLASDSAQTFQHNGSGLKAYGDGIYFTANSNPSPGTFPGGDDIDFARDCSLNYGDKGHRATACVTLSSSANLADGDQLYKEFKRLPFKEQLQYRSGDYRDCVDGLSGYAVARGYDGLRWKGAGSQCDYLTIYNRKKLIVLDDPDNTAFGIRG